MRLRSVGGEKAVVTIDYREGHASGDSPLVWASHAMEDILRFAAEVGASDAKVLIGGESGVGKDGVARFVHANSPRAHWPLITVNCAALSDGLLESELFGHTRGSFTGAYRDKVGQLRRAHQGTVFLDEVGEMSPRMQALLLRFLENGEVQPIGAHSAGAPVDVRVLAATNRSLDESVARGRFRADLLYRLQVIHLVVPPLRERREDIPVLVEHFLARAGRRLTVSEAAMSELVAWRWPGNVRELRNVVDQMVALAKTDVILREHLPTGFGAQRKTRSGPVERRRQIADDLFEALASGQCSFWDDVHPLFLMRDLTRHDIRELVRRGLANSRGNYHALLRLFGMPQEDYKRFLNFLTTHDCSVDFRPFRSAELEATPARARRIQLPGAKPCSNPLNGSAHDPHP
jgi:transcriptional regulator with GAF, ATPase, and Fis domain